MSHSSSPNADGTTPPAAINPTPLGGPPVRSRSANEQPPAHPGVPLNRNWGIIRICAIYALISGLWIIFSDQVAVLLAPDPAALLTVNTLKGWGFVIFTALLLYGLIRRYTTRLLETRVQSAAAVHAAEEKYRDIVENALEGIFQTTPEGRYLAANPALARIYGYDSPAELISSFNNIDKQVYVDPVRRAEYMRLLAERGKVRGLENANYRKDGRVIWVRVNAHAVRDEAGAVLYYEGSVEDITERKRNEEAIQRLAAIVESSDDAIIGKTLEGIITSWNQGAEKLYGYSAQEIIGRSINILVPPDHVAELPDILDRVRRGESIDHYEAIRVRQDGQHLYVSVSISPIRNIAGQIVGASSIAYDITERQRAEGARKRAEEALHMSQTRFQRYFELGLIGLAITSPTKGWIEVNDEICKILGYQREELLQTIWPELTHPDDLAADVANFDRVLAGKIDGYSMDKRFIRKDGQIVYASIALNCQRRADGSVDYFVALLQDITERRQAEAAERDQRALAEALRDTAAAVNSTLDFEEILDHILGNIERVVPLTTANVMLHKGNILQIVRARGFESYVRSLEHMPQVFVLNDYANLRSIVATGQPQLIEDTRQYRDWVVMPELEWIRSFLSVPIMIDSQVVGLINLNADQPGFYTTDHMTRLQAFSDQAAIALKNARLLIEAHERAEELKLSQEQLRAVSTRAESMREEERITIAREIHDDLGQSLTGLKMDLAWLTKRLPASQQRASLQTKLQDMSDLIDQLIQSVRRIATELRPGVLDDLGLIAAIEWQADDFQSRTGIVCKTAANVTDTALNKNQATAVFRIFLETLTNVARHAQATHIQIRLNELKRVFTLDVLDNGRGLPDDAINDPKSLGLAGMRERALAVGGQLSIVGAAEGGTLMRLSFPLEHA